LGGRDAYQIFKDPGKILAGTEPGIKRNFGDGLLAVPQGQLGQPDAKTVQQARGGIAGEFFGESFKLRALEAAGGGHGAEGPWLGAAGAKFIGELQDAWLAGAVRLAPAFDGAGVFYQFAKHGPGQGDDIGARQGAWLRQFFRQAHHDPGEIVAGHKTPVTNG